MFYRSWVPLCLLLIWLAFLAGGIALAGWAAAADHFPGDIGVGRWIQAHDVPGRDVMEFVRDVGSSIVALVTVTLGVATLVLLRRPRMAAVSALLYPGLAFGALLKVVVDRPRTSVDFLEQWASFSSKSFPSGHVLGSLLGYGLLLYLVWRLPASLWLRAIVSLWAGGVLLLTPWVSVSGGVHWPSDVLGGLVWAAVLLIPVVMGLEWASRRDRCLPLRGRDPDAPAGANRRSGAAPRAG